jgi:hypothetical protein
MTGGEQSINQHERAGEGRRETQNVCVHEARATKRHAHARINAGDDVIRREQYAQCAQTAARNATINKHRHQVGVHMQLFCSCDVVLTLKLVCGLAKKKIMSHVEVLVPT